MGKEEYRLILRFTAIKKPKAKGFWLFKNKFFTNLCYKQILP